MDNHAEQLQIKSQLKHSIAIIPIQDGVGLLPKDFRAMGLALYYPWIPQLDKLAENIKTTHEDRYPGLTGTLLVDQACHRCHQEECNHGKPIVDLDLYDTRRMQTFSDYNRFIASFHEAYQQGGYYCNGNFPGGYLMHARTNAFFGVSYHVGNCINLNLDTPLEYELDLPRVMTPGIDSGYMVISYAAIRLDKNGYRMVPKTAKVVNAIVAGVRMNLAAIDYEEKRTNAERTYWMDMRRDYDNLMAVAMNQLNGPDMDEEIVFNRNHWQKMIPYSNWPENLNRLMNDQFRYPIQSSNL